MTVIWLTVDRARSLFLYRTCRPNVIRQNDFRPKDAAPQKNRYFLLKCHRNFEKCFLLMLKIVLIKYCIEGISETPNASADFYCQSNTNNNTRTSCAFYEKSLQVNHRLDTQKERARYCEMGREGERRDGVRIRRGFNRG
jgi:hypothetical protein